MIYIIERRQKMNISEKLSLEQLQTILMNIYTKGEETEDLKALDLIKDIKQGVLEAMQDADTKNT
ncbi:hypothetical protein ACFFH4_13515 [Halalkalibacter alkalisediminis]|uniref:Uncharacterized protein n=2 Tax=Halalkalibacter alkalisediminis TaxID=935616 RepID=A0ABV6NH23_9BACI